MTISGSASDLRSIEYCLNRKSGIQKRYSHHTGSVSPFATENAHVWRYGISFSHGTWTTGSGGSLWMYAISRALTERCDPGGAYSGHQSSSQRKPSAPVATNGAGHPNASVIHGTTSGVTTAPMFVPELKMPVASARSFLGNHSATVLIAAGKLPASPLPRNARATPKPDTARE